MINLNRTGHTPDSVVPTCDVLHGPKVGGEQHHDDDEAGDEAEAEEAAQHVRQDRAEAEQQVEQRDERVPVGRGHGDRRGQVR